MIVGDLPDVSFRQDPLDEFSTLLGKRVQFNGVVDDLHILFRIKTLPAGVGGRADVSWIRTDSKLPIIAEMAIDPSQATDAMVDSGTFYKLVLHEIGHCLGFGTIWRDKQLLKRPSWDGWSDPYFAGPMAQLEFYSLIDWADYSGNAVPVQAGGDDGHWRLSVFGDELMVAGWVSPTDKGVSELTLMSMVDLGYEVNWYAADESYVLPSRQAAKALAETVQPICSLEHYPTKER